MQASHTILRQEGDDCSALRHVRMVCHSCQAHSPPFVKDSAPC
jgi:hypothetical protein